MRKLEPKSRRLICGASAFQSVITLSVIGMLIFILSKRFFPVIERVEQESMEQVAMQLQQITRQAYLAAQSRSHRSGNWLQLSDRTGLSLTGSHAEQARINDTWHVLIDQETGYPVSAKVVSQSVLHGEIGIESESSDDKRMITARTMRAEDCKMLLLATLRFSNEAAVSTNFAERENSRFFVTVKENGTTKICVFYQTSMLQSLLEPPEGDDYREVGNNFAYDPATGTVDVNLNRSLTTTGL